MTTTGIGYRIRVLRILENENQLQMARRISVVQSTVSMLEHNAYPADPNPLYKKIASVYGVRQSWLVYGQGRMRDKVEND
ncbi:XRE family transcriptional regulator [Periweissella cryptocerci]|uniref:XRE family transcriptional regulator n=1 Tax=Periweissella cryptocerci TaxID=2506420 RepID=A0A4P6YX82_9LACO|nr:helix-turn-helix transcriptional regulator [Periweissella cryptocerci]QBO37363.1 XRE family transcriptional regulator [Periweissella cryptocerci]